MLNKIFLLEPEITRADFDRAFDAHWHSGFLIRHLIYSHSRSEVKANNIESPGLSRKSKTMAPPKISKFVRSKVTRSRLLHSLDDAESDDEDY